MNKLSLFLMICIFAVSGISLSGCNTAKGFGKDMEHAGEKIQNM
jgi:predicted small secreted protein